MPLHTAITQDGSVADGTKAKIAEEIARIHAAVVKVPRAFVRVVFLCYPKGSGYSPDEEAPSVEGEQEVVARLDGAARA